MIIKCCMTLIFRHTRYFLAAFLLMYVFAVVLFFRTPPVAVDLSESSFDSHPKHNHDDIDRFVVFREKRFQAAQTKVHNLFLPGELGVAVVLNASEQAEADRLFLVETFNVIASNKVPMDRSIPDTRMHE